MQTQTASPAAPRHVALVGRPNVGKSRMFNRLVGRRVAIVHDMPGVTRDLAVANVADGYTLMDTGGIGMRPEMTPAKIHEAAEEQVDFAIQAAALILFVLDGGEGPTAVDLELAAKLRSHGKTVLPVVNKIDILRARDISEFHALGLGEPLPVSAEHGQGFSELNQAILRELGPPPPQPEASQDIAKARIRMCLCGRPNVGKSSLGNTFLHDRRLIVSDIAGTTRDAVETDLDYKADDGSVWHFRLIDTAGVKPRRKLASSLDYFSSLRTDEAVDRADVAVLVIDALSGVTKHDKKFAGDILKSGAGLVVAVNKWDLARVKFKHGESLKGYDNERDFREQFTAALRRELFFLPDSPVSFVSALTEHGIARLLADVHSVYQHMRRTLPTPKINAVLAELLEKRRPKISGGRRFKVYYAVQTGHRPTRIRVFCNRAEFLDESYRRYLAAGITEHFGLRGCPVQFDLRGKPPRTA